VSETPSPREPWEVRAYASLRRLRDALLAPLARPLARLGLAPAAVSLGGVALAVSTGWSFEAAPHLALAGATGALLADALDGAVARHQGRGSARGKLLDHACDAATFVALVAAPWVAGRVPPTAALAGGLLPTLTVVLGMAREARRSGPRWWHHPRAGFAAHLPKGFYLTAFFLHLAGGPEWLVPALWMGGAAAVAVLLIGTVGLLKGGPSGT